MVDFPRFVPTFHHEPYPAIDPSRTDLRGKVVMITGGASGIGRATCRAFAQAGVRDLIILDRNQKALFSVRDELNRDHGTQTTVHSFVANIVDAPLVDEIPATVGSEIGSIDILVCNAGYQSAPATLGKDQAQDWWHTFEVNVRGSYNLTRAFLRDAKPGAVLINLSSVLTHWHTSEGYLDGHSSYSASKIAITRTMEIVQRENPEIRVVNVHPGLIATAMSAKAGNTALSTDNGMDPILDFAHSAADTTIKVNLPAHFIVWAAGPEADFLSGRLVWANWDVEELKLKKEEIIQNDLLTLGLRGFEY
jgi:NAD(P)-dependent dehydrogenase (short-subunit alcohol dehydrogenase family)